jgi:hypothetical protein
VTITLCGISVSIMILLWYNCVDFLILLWLYYLDYIWHVLFIHAIFLEATT